MDLSRLLDKLRKIEMLHAGAIAAGDHGKESRKMPRRRRARPHRLMEGKPVLDGITSSGRFRPKHF